jgi:hypothetical protein
MFSGPSFFITTIIHGSVILGDVPGVIMSAVTPIMLCNIVHVAMSISIQNEEICRNSMPNAQQSLQKKW